MVCCELLLAKQYICAQYSDFAGAPPTLLPSFSLFHLISMSLHLFFFHFLKLNYVVSILVIILCYTITLLLLHYTITLYHYISDCLSMSLE